MDHSNVLSVPSEFLKPGSTPKTIERQLRHDSRFHWSRRGRTNKLIIMDWKSEKFPEPRDESPLAILKVRLGLPSCRISSRQLFYRSSYDFFQTRFD